MSGRPVWLASVSKRKPNTGQMIPTARWGPGVRRAALTVAHRTLGPVGEPSMERAFLMCATLCYHRAASDAEIEALPDGPGGLAGPPFDQVIHETDACPPAGLSFTPCDHRTIVRMGKPGFYRPVDDCGQCPSCLARAEVEGP